MTPRIILQDVEGLVSFIKRVFGASGDYVQGRPSEMKLGDSMIMVSGEGERMAANAVLYVYVEDVDAVYRRALAAGAESREQPMDLPYGDRRAMVVDSWGNTWQIATRIST